MSEHIDNTLSLLLDELKLIQFESSSNNKKWEQIKRTIIDNLMPRIRTIEVENRQDEMLGNIQALNRRLIDIEQFVAKH